MLQKPMNNIRVIGTLSIFLFFTACGTQTIFKEKWTTIEAPATFKARFETTKGNFDIVSQRAWSPKAVDRLYQLIKSDFYTDVALFRVVPDFVAQFGIHNTSELNKSWNSLKVPDEPVIEKNVEGTLAFARGGKGTRTSQLFINLKSNSPRLDTLNYNGVKGFPVIAKITQGWPVIKEFYDGYGEQPGKKQDSIQKMGNQYLKRHFSKLDYIKKAYILE